jgi:predicted SAM-dependent methyltransferase
MNFIYIVNPPINMPLNCPCCNSMEVRIGAQKFGYEILRCKKCTVEFVSPIPTKDELEKFYDNSNITLDTKNQIKKNIAVLENEHDSPLKIWYIKIIDLGKHFCKKSKLDILEIGSAYGLFVHLANLLGNNAVGTESTRTYSEATDGIINGKIIYVENNQYEKYFQQNAFDLIYLEHVFEHLANPGPILDKLRLLLRENGIIVILVPNHGSFLARLYGTKWSWVHPPAHLFHYNKTSLSNLLELHNLDVVKGWTGDYLRTIHHFYSLNSVTNKIKARINKYFNTNYKFVSNPILYKKNPYSPDLIPYWFMFPLLKILNYANLGNELIMVAKKSPLSKITKYENL